MKKITLYHGSNVLFDRFKITTKRQHGKDLGYGIYLTDDKEKAISYCGEEGFLYTCEVVLREELYTDKVTLTKDNLNDLCKSLVTGTTILTTYGDPDMEDCALILSRALEDLDGLLSESQMITVLINALSNPELTLEKLYSITGKNYSMSKKEDGYLGSNVYVITRPTDIKILDIQRVESSKAKKIIKF